jgi:hypothetical protein
MESYSLETPRTFKVLKKGLKLDPSRRLNVVREICSGGAQYEKL